MKKLITLIVFLFIFIQTTAFPKTASSAPSFSVYAAASLTGPLKEIIAAFQEETKSHVKVNFASSGNLARQIEQGAPADIFICASLKWMDYAQDQQLITPNTRFNLISNSLVLIAPKNTPPIKVSFDSKFSLANHFNGKFSIGDPDHVPAGKYAKQAMLALGWWDALNPRLIRAKDVRQALMIVEAGEVTLGAVYGSDAYKSQKVHIISSFPENLHAPIIYAAALCHSPLENSIAAHFLTYLKSEKSQNTFMHYGFKKIE